MGKTIKKILCTLLVVVMCLTSVPLGGFVGLELPEIGISEWFSSQASATDELAATGQCGDNVFWDFDERTGELVISGSGEMYDYSWHSAPNYSPFRNNSNIQYLSIEKGITSIGNSVFVGCYSITSIIIPESVTYIGDHAFYCCRNLVNIAIPNSVTKIGDGAFAECENVENITLPDSVNRIGNGAFNYCKKLTSIAIPNGVDNIGNYTFNNCKNLTSIVIPDSVKSIGDYALSGCESIESIILPDSVKSIGKYAFGGCYRITSVAIPDSVISIGEGVFNCCYNLTSITIPDSVTNIGAGAFRNCSKLINITIPNSITSISRETFASCTNLTIVDLPNSVEIIGSGAFSSCSSLKNITIPDSVYIIEDRAFSCCVNLASITIPNKVIIIGEYAFNQCKNLTSITIPNNVTNIGDYAFSQCDNLKSITVDKDNNHYCSIDGVLFNKNKTELIQYPNGNIRESYSIPDSVMRIGDSAFYCCRNLVSIKISNSVANIGDNAFFYCNVKRITVDENNTYYCSVDGVLFDKNKTELIRYPIGNVRKSYIIPNGVTSIGDSSFSHCYNLTNITIPDSVISIGYSAFFVCKNLKDVYYDSTEEQWKKIDINTKHSSNEYLTNAIIHYNSSGNELTDNLFFNHSMMTISNNICPNISVKTYPDGVTKDDIIWASSNERVAYIDGSTINPIQYGKTLITASTKDGKYSASCELTVQSSFVITSTNSSLSSIKAGEEAEYSVMLLDYEGNKLPVENVTLSNESSKYLEIINQERTETEIKLTVKGLKAGTAVLEFEKDEPLTHNSFVFDVYPATVTYRADKVPIRDEELKTNFSRSGMFVENFRYYSVGEPAEYYMALMNIYNKNSSVGIVASYTQDGQLYDIAEVKKHQAMPTDYFEFLAVLGKGAVDIALLNTYNYRYSVESTKTEIEIKVPINGYLTVSNDIKSSPINFVYGMISLAVETAFQLAEDLTSIDGDKKSTVVKKLTKEVTDYFSKNTDHFDKLIKELSKDVIKNTTKLNIVSMGNYSLDIVSTIFAAMQKDFDDVFNSALEEVVKDSAHTFIEMAMMKDFINNKAIDKVTGGYIKAGEIMFNAAEHFNIVAEIIDISHSANSGVTTVTFGKCNEDGFVCKDTIKVNLKEEQEILDAIYLQHYQIYIDKNQLTLRPEIKDLNLKENSVVEVHEITVMRDGVPYEIKKEVSVEVDIPDGWATFNFKIYRVEPDGKLTNMFARVANGKAYFTTDHFSEYIFVGELEDTHTHSYTTTTVNSTCTESGSITYTCYCGDTYIETIPTNGHTFNGSTCTNCGYDKADECDCNCHASGIKKFFFNFILFFQKLFKKNAVCDCGVAHY